MVRKLAYLLVILAVLTAVGELCGLLLPTLSSVSYTHLTLPTILRV